MKTCRINLIDEASFEETSEIVRDGEFANSDFHFNTVEHTVKLSLWKADEELSSFGRTGLFVCSRISPMRRLELIFRSVVSVEFVKQSNGTGNHPLGDIRWNKRKTICIDTYDGLMIELTIANLDATLHITEDIDRNRNQRRRFCSLFRRLKKCQERTFGSPRGRRNGDGSSY